MAGSVLTLAAPRAARPARRRPAPGVAICAEPGGARSGGDGQRVVSRGGRHRHLGPAVGLENLIVVYGPPVEDDGRGPRATGEGVADDDLIGAHAGGGVDLGAVAAPGVGGQHVGGPAAEPDVLSLHRGLALRHLRDELDEVTAEVGPHAQPLVYDGPRGAVVAPRL